MNNKSIDFCKNCEELYCFECSNNKNWAEFCSKECEEEYKKKFEVNDK